MQRAGAAGYVLGGEGCRELARVLMFRTVDGGGVGKMHFWTDGMPRSENFLG